MSGIEKKEFIELFQQMRIPIRNFVYYRTGDIEVADDITQEVFVKIWEKRSNIKTATIKSLLYTIAGNLCKNRFEHLKVKLGFENSFQQRIETVSPEFELEMKEFGDKLNAALGRLSEKNRDVFLMNRIDGYKYLEIAEILGLSVKAVEKRMSSALKELKKSIAYKI